jgi:hypothetical protein
MMINPPHHILSNGYFAGTFYRLFVWLLLSDVFLLCHTLGELQMFLQGRKGLAGEFL